VGELTALMYLLYVAAIMAAVFVVAHRVSERRRLAGKTCHRCGTRMVETVSCVYEERRDDYVVVPRVDLVRHACPTCGRETRELKAVGWVVWEPGKRVSGLSIRPASPDVSVRTVKEIREWDRAVARLEKEHGARLRIR